MNNYLKYIKYKNKYNNIKKAIKIDQEYKNELNKHDIPLVLNIMSWNILAHWTTLYQEKNIQQEKDIQQEKGSEQPTHVTNALFVGSTAELQKLIKGN